MAAEISVRWWKGNEPKLTKHAEWEKDVVPLLMSWESTKKSVDDPSGGTDIGFFAEKLHGYGVALQKAVKAKHDWLNPVVHGATRKKLEELLAELLTKTGEAEAVAKMAELSKDRAKQLNPNAGRPLPKLPPSKNDVLTKLEEKSRGTGG